MLADVKLRENASGVGYVSGHTAVAFALAAVLAPSLPRGWRPVVFAVASVVAFARVYSGAHLPLDVVGGAGLGLLCGTLLRWAFGLGGEGLRSACPRLTTRGSDQMKPRRSSRWKLIQPGRIGIQYVTSR